MNIYDIAKLANVSIATVSRVVNNSPKVSPKTKEKVLAVMKENEYTPNAFARGLGLGSMKTVGIICPNIDDIYICYFINFRYLSCQSLPRVDRHETFSALSGGYRAACSYQQDFHLFKLLQDTRVIFLKHCSMLKVYIFFFNNVKYMPKKYVDRFLSALRISVESQTR